MKAVLSIPCPTLLTATNDGAIEFKSERRSWGVDIPAYVYDLWLPLFGATAIGVYGVYCRLERNGEVKGMSTKKLAAMCRVGDKTLSQINEALQDCGFVRIEQPEGWKRWAHFTMRIVTLDAPMKVTQEKIEKWWRVFGRSDEITYIPLSPWLIDEDRPTNAFTSSIDDASVVNQRHEEASIGDAKFEPSIEPYKIPNADPQGGSGEGQPTASSKPFSSDDLEPTLGVHQKVARKVKKPVVDLSSHPLVLFLQDKNLNQRLTQKQLDKLGERITVMQEDGGRRAYRGLLTQYTETLGFSDFCAERAAQFTAINDGVLELEHLIANLGRFINLKYPENPRAWPGWLQWRDQHPAVTKPLAARAPVEVESYPSEDNEVKPWNIEWKPQRQ